MKLSFGGDYREIWKYHLQCTRIRMWSILVVLTVCLRINGYTYREEGELCQTSNGIEGICRHFNSCTTAIKEVQARRQPVTCKFEGIYPVVCCENEKLSTTTLAKVMPEDKQDGLPPLQRTSLDGNNKVLRKIGDICEKRNGTKGICMNFSNCTTAFEEIQVNGELEVCNFQGNNSVICCSTPVKSRFGDKINKKPEPANKPHKSDNQLPQRSYIPIDENNIYLRKCSDFYPTRLPVGRPVRGAEFPHMAALGYGEPDNIRWQCGGSLISNQFVLTAAHCLTSGSSGKVRFIRLGDIDLDSTTDDADSQDFTVIETHIPYPNYTTSSTYHDIALVRLDRPVKVTNYVTPACIGITKNLLGKDHQAIGWDFSGNSAYGNILQNGSMSTLPGELCKENYGTSIRFRQGIIDEFQICAEGVESGEDTCEGDFGGSLQISNSRYDIINFPEIVGITTYRRRCTLAAAVYTRVYSYAPWIAGIVWPDE